MTLWAANALLVEPWPTITQIMHAFDKIMIIIHCMLLGSNICLISLLYFDVNLFLSYSGLWSHRSQTEHKG